MVRMAFCDQPGGGLAISVEALGLEVRTLRPSDARPFVPVESEPPHPVEDACDHVGRRSLNVCVFDSEHERAACRRAYSQLKSAVRAPPTWR